MQIKSHLHFPSAPEGLPNVRQTYPHIHNQRIFPCPVKNPLAFILPLGGGKISLALFHVHIWISLMTRQVRRLFAVFVAHVNLMNLLSILTSLHILLVVFFESGIIGTHRIPIYAPAFKCNRKIIRACIDIKTTISVKVLWGNSKISQM